MAQWSHSPKGPPSQESSVLIMTGGEDRQAHHRRTGDLSLCRVQLENQYLLGHKTQGSWPPCGQCGGLQPWPCGSVFQIKLLCNGSHTSHQEEVFPFPLKLGWPRAYVTTNKCKSAGEVGESRTKGALFILSAWGSTSTTGTSPA